MNFEDFLNTLSQPAKRALLHEKILSFGDLASYTEKEILSLHGIGKSSLPKMYQALQKNKLAFRNDN